MKTVYATDMENRFGTLMDMALAEPVIVKKCDRSAVVMLSAAEYDRLICMQEAYWEARATNNENESTN